MVVVVMVISCGFGGKGEKRKEKKRKKRRKKKIKNKKKNTREIFNIRQPNFFFRCHFNRFSYCFFMFFVIITKSHSGAERNGAHKDTKP